MKNPPQLKLTLDGEGEPGERCVLVDVLEEAGPGSARRIGHLYVPIEAVPQLGALGVLVGLGVLASLTIAGEGAPTVLVLEPRMVRLMKIAAKVLA